MDTIANEVRAEIRNAIAAYKAEASVPHVLDYSLEVACVEWPVQIAYYYTPAERMTREHPGCLAEVEIVSIKAGGIDIQDALPREVIRTMLDELGDGKAAPRAQRRGDNDY